MSDRVKPKIHRPELAHETADFDCGDESWAVPLNEFIKNDAFKYMKKYGTKVWLYDNDSGERVGYGSIGITKWTVRPGEDDRKALVILPNVAVRIEQQRKGYARQICHHLIEEAQIEYDARVSKGEDILPLFGLLVHPLNVGARCLYKAIGFSDFPYTYQDSSEEVTYQGMGLKLKSAQDSVDQSQAK